MSPKLKKLIGRKIKLLRVSRSMSQKELASLLKITPTYLCMGENGKVNMSLDLLERILTIFGEVNMVWFFTPINTYSSKEIGC